MSGSRGRQEWVDANGPCVKCGSSVDLEVDHIDRSQKAYNPRALWSLAENNQKRIDELAKCQVLCEKCHKEKTREESKTNKHGTYAMRNTWNCRCDKCMEYVRRVKQESRARIAARNNGV